MEGLGGLAVSKITSYIWNTGLWSFASGLSSKFACSSKSNHCFTSLLGSWLIGEKGLWELFLLPLSSSSIAQFSMPFTILVMWLYCPSSPCCCKQDHVTTAQGQYCHCFGHLRDLYPRQLLRQEPRLLCVCVQPFFFSLCKPLMKQREKKRHLGWQWWWCADGRSSCKQVLARCVAPFWRSAKAQLASRSDSFSPSECLRLRGIMLSTFVIDSSCCVTKHNSFVWGFNINLLH